MRCAGKTPAGRCRRDVKAGFDVCQFHLEQATRTPTRPGDTLSPRQRECAVLASTGKTNREIAEALGISTSTVDVHMREVTRRVGYNRRNLKGKI